MKKGKELLLYEYGRNFIYSPIYYTFLAEKSESKNSNNNETPFDFYKDESKPDNIIGDKGVINNLVHHNTDKIPLGICDPMAILYLLWDDKYDSKRELSECKIIFSLIDKFAIWLICLVHDENKYVYTDLFEDRALEGTEGDLSDMKYLIKKEIYYSQNGLSDSIIFENFFKSAFQERKPELENLNDEIMALKLGYNILSNNPWLLELNIRYEENAKFAIKNPSVFILRSFLRKRLPFSCFIARKKDIDPQNENRILIINLLDKIHKNIFDFYKESNDDVLGNYYKYLLEEEKNNTPFFPFTLEKIEKNDFIKYIKKLINNNIYPYFPYISKEMWSNSVSCFLKYLRFKERNEKEIVDSEYKNLFEQFVDNSLVDEILSNEINRVGNREV